MYFNGFLHFMYVKTLYFTNYRQYLSIQVFKIIQLHLYISKENIFIQKKYSLKLQDVYAMSVRLKLHNV